MEFFHKAKAVRLKSQHGRYLAADYDEETVKQRTTGSSPDTRWTVEFIEGKPNLIRLKSSQSWKYLCSSEGNSLLGLTGNKVIQAPPRMKTQPEVEWEPVKEGMYLKLKTSRGRFLKANGQLWRYSVTHDLASTTATQEWVYWVVDVLEFVGHGSDGGGGDAEVEKKVVGDGGGVSRSGSTGSNGGGGGSVPGSSGGSVRSPRGPPPSHTTVMKSLAEQKSEKEKLNPPPASKPVPPSRQDDQYHQPSKFSPPPNQSIFEEDEPPRKPPPIYNPPPPTNKTPTPASNPQPPTRQDEYRRSRFSPPDQPIFDKYEPPLKPPPIYNPPTNKTPNPTPVPKPEPPPNRQDEYQPSRFSPPYQPIYDKNEPPQKPPIYNPPPPNRPTTPPTRIPQQYNPRGSGSSHKLNSLLGDFKNIDHTDNYGMTQAFEDVETIIVDQRQRLPPEFHRAKETLKTIKNEDFKSSYYTGHIKKIEKAITTLLSYNYHLKPQTQAKLQRFLDQIENLRVNHDTAFTNLDEFEKFVARRTEMRADVQQDATKAREMQNAEQDCLGALTVARGKREELLRQLAEVDVEIRLAEEKVKENEVKIEELCGVIGRKKEVFMEIERAEKSWLEKKNEAKRMIRHVEREWEEMKIGFEMLE